MEEVRVINSGGQGRKKSDRKTGATTKKVIYSGGWGQNNLKGA